MAESTLDVAQIKKLLPHRPPMLLVERLTDIVKMESATGWKAIGINEPYFLGHFPDYAVMPGVLIVEAMAQTAAVLVVHTLGAAFQGKLVYFMSIDGAKFRTPVEPGCLLDLHVDLVQIRGRVCKFTGKAMVEGKLCAEASFVAMIADPPVD